MKSEIVIVKDSEDDIFLRLEDDVFCDVVSQDELRSYLTIEIGENQVDVETHAALRRAVNIAVTDGLRCYNKR